MKKILFFTFILFFNTLVFSKNYTTETNILNEAYGFQLGDLIVIEDKIISNKKFLKVPKLIIKKMPNYGFRKFIDSEQDLENEIFLRPSVKQKILTDYKNMKNIIFNIFSKKQLKQIEINEDINLESIQKYFSGNYI